MFMVCDLDRLRVNVVVLPMCTDEPHVNNTVGVVDPYDYAVLVAADVEDNATILKDARCPKLRLHLTRLGPVCLQRVPVPRERGRLSVLVFRMIVPERLERRDGNHPHRRHPSPKMGPTQAMVKLASTEQSSIAFVCHKS